MTGWDMTLRAVPGIPRVHPGDDIAALIHTALTADGHQVQDADVLVITQKVVSRAEDRVVRLADVTPTPRADNLAGLTGRDPRLCQLYLDESRHVMEILGRHVVTVDNHGIYDTSAGVDSSNAGPFAEGWACLLPVDPDASARHIRELTGTTIAVIISDSGGSRLIVIATRPATARAT